MTCMAYIMTKSTENNDKNVKVGQNSVVFGTGTKQISSMHNFDRINCYRWHHEWNYGTSFYSFDIFHRVGSKMKETSHFHGIMNESKEACIKAL